MAYYRTPHDVTTLPAWQALTDHRKAMQNFSMREAFNENPQRFNEFSLSSSGLFLDYSKNLITAETRQLLVNLANEVGLKDAIKAQYDGELVNSSEGRPALHTALRRARSPMTRATAGMALALAATLLLSTDTWTSAAWVPLAVVLGATRSRTRS